MASGWREVVCFLKTAICKARGQVAPKERHHFLPASRDVGRNPTCYFFTSFKTQKQNKSHVWFNSVHVCPRVTLTLPFAFSQFHLSSGLLKNDFGKLSLLCVYSWHFSLFFLPYLFVHLTGNEVRTRQFPRGENFEIYSVFNSCVYV